MQHLKTLIGSGYRHGYTNGHGADGTVSSLEWALNHLDNEPSTAENYSFHAGSNLESRLFAAYVIRSLACIKLGENDKAKVEYNKAVTLSKLAADSHGLIPSISAEQVEETLALVERRLRLAGVSL